MSSNSSVVYYCRHCEMGKRVSVNEAVAHGAPRCCGEKMGRQQPKDLRRAVEKYAGTNNRQLIIR